MNATAVKCLPLLANQLNKLADLADLDERNISQTVARTALTLSWNLDTFAGLLEHSNQDRWAELANPWEDSELYDALKGASRLCGQMTREGPGQPASGERLRSAARLIHGEATRRNPPETKRRGRKPGSKSRGAKRPLVEAALRKDETDESIKRRLKVKQGTIDKYRRDMNRKDGQ